ncbi:SusD family protein [Mucilaginibacter pineti]|uniref:SusD family protein n=1 Tax=Mucilaginibacter pineti TaxID=1391627 RepID=A0A1G7EV24_9SPHI|nr:RagB/SusD family nutrient uptake outer membrane protein [Mucilaginibacter pineti]SDE67489.1 SusD family protein [Mucilaginibacter pineti]
MKKLLLLFTIFISIALQSCKKYLDVPPYNQVSDGNTIFDAASAQTAVRGAYRGLASLNYSATFQNIVLQSGGDVRSINNAQTDLNVINYDLRSDIPLLLTLWSNNYNTINRANQVIAKVPLVTDINLTQSLKDQLLGEGYFIRALSYFDLARLFGNVPIFLTPTNKVSDKVGTAKSTQAQVYAQVLDDLNKAEALLPTTVVRNRATKYTVYALRARLNLYLQKYQEAENDVNSILANNSSYKLITPFALAAGTTESVLELSYNTTDVNGAFSLWNGNNRALEPKASLYNLLNDPLVGGGRKILATKTGTAIYGGISPTNISAGYVIRTAELYLIRAEARVKKVSPDLNGALDDLDAVRLRSGLVKSTAATSNEILLAIENERQVEFALEPHRWFDLVRTGRAPAVLNLSDANKYIFPIPGAEILANPALVQNNGYNH